MAGVEVSLVVVAEPDTRGRTEAVVLVADTRGRMEEVLLPDIRVSHRVAHSGAHR